MNELKVFDNKELNLQVRTAIDDEGNISFNAEDTALGFGWYKSEVKNGKTYFSIRWDRMSDYCKEFGFDHKLSKDDFIPESLYYLLGMKASNERAKKFQIWLATEVLPSLRRTGMCEIKQAEKSGDAITLSDRFKAMELISNCPQHALSYVVDIAKPFMSSEKAEVKREVTCEISATCENLPVEKKRRDISGYSVPFNLKRLVRHLNKIGWTGIELSYHSGIDKSSIRRYLKGENRPSMINRYNICKALNKPADWLNGGGLA